MATGLKILVAEDDFNFRAEFARWLHGKGHHVEQAGDARAALRLFDIAEGAEAFDLAILDYTLPGENGVDLLKKLLRIREDLPVIVVTGIGNKSVCREALQAGAFWYLDKPPDLVETETLLSWVARWQEPRQYIANQTQHFFPTHHPLSAVSHVLSKTTEDELYTGIRTEIFPMLGANECVLAFVEIETGKIKNIVSTWKDKEIISYHHYTDRWLPPKDLILNEPHHIIVSDVEHEENLHPDFIKSGVRAFGVSACPPDTPSVSEVPAVLYGYFYNPLSESQRLEFELNLIVISRFVGVAIERMRQEKLTKDLVKSSLKLLMADSEEAIYKIFKQIIEESAIEVSFFYFARYDKNSNEISFPLVISEGKEVELTEPSRPYIPGGKGLTEHIIHTGEAYASEDVHADKSGPQPIEVGGIRTTSYYGAPVKRPNGEIIGVIALQRCVRYAFTEPTQPILLGLAAQLGLALNYLELRRLQRDRAIKAGADSVWKDVSIRVAHKMGNPTSVVETYLDLLKDCIEQGSTDEGLEIVTRMSEAVERIKDLLVQFRSLATAERIECQPTMVDTLLDSSLAIARSRGIQVRLSLESCPLVLADPQRLGECFDELVANARYWLDTQEKRIDVSVTQASEKDIIFGLDHAKSYLLIIFADNGSGVLQEDKKRIFAPFFSTSPQGTGLGLALVRHIILRHEGDIVEDGQPGSGARFKIFLPMVDQAVECTGQDNTRDA